MPVVMAGLIIGHAGGNPPVLPRVALTKKQSVAKCSVWAHVSAAVMCYPDLAI